nr:MAG TPA_asm: hypothetical protein [Caudoviricetes sp.]
MSENSSVPMYLSTVMTCIKTIVISITSVIEVEYFASKI